ncbi:response regulator transcription factor [Agromyces sp. NPDC049794]|uniref:response regulator transcription factor n=1 Tax=unclassified Agromyces TaxID=2639701 RepID=UPI003402F07C
MTSLVVVDDHPLFRKGIVALLEASGFDVVAEAASAAEAIEVVMAVRPDVVLMDLGLPDRSGLAATAHLSAALPATRFVVITMYDDAETVRRALEAGADAYVTKDASPDQVVAAVEAVLMGAQWLGSGVPRPTADPGTAATHGAADLPGLTPRERSIAELVGRGLPNEAIAERLGLSRKTVANYVSSVLLKLGAVDRLEAARIVRRSTDR